MNNPRSVPLKKQWKRRRMRWLKGHRKEDVSEETIRPAAQQSPFDQSIRESISKQNEMRKEQLKQFTIPLKTTKSH